ncbi:TRL domain-containing protein [Enterobacter cloacae]|uniref:TRL domain-containing protein n=1 Tax=Enterobacter cloacae TaxID=550 RepID=UPI0034A0B7D4
MASGCTTQQKPIGLFYTDTVDLVSIGADGYPMHSGESCSVSVFGLVTVGNSGACAAMKNGNLGRAVLIENRVVGGVGIYKYCTIVYGPYGDPGPPPPMSNGEGTRQTSCQK